MPSSKPKTKRPKPTFGDQLRRRREKAGLSIGELATLSGVDRSTIYVAETGKREIRTTNKFKLLNALESSPISGNNDMPNNNLDRAILAVQRLALAAERIANALENPTKN